MKTVFALMTLFSLQMASASETTLVKGDLRLSAVEGRLVSAKPICPKVPGRPSCMAIGSTLTISVGFVGCLDRLAGYSSKVEVINGKGIVYFSALAIQTEESMHVRCFRQATQQIQIHSNFEGEFELVNLDFQGTNN